MSKATDASTYEGVKPLIDLCSSGRLFAVQEWIASGKPVNLPDEPMSGGRGRSPLEVAMGKGFHSLVEVLLKGGAEIERPNYCALRHAVFMRRLDMIELLVEFGADIHSVDMATVFESWDPKIMTFFIDRGADVETDNPLAFALCNRIRTALGIFRARKEQFSSFQEQANIALRHHCRDGNLKWVSLMLWAGADPHAKGLGSWHEDPDPELYTTALEAAAIRGHTEIFKMKYVRLDPDHPGANELLHDACYGGKSDLLKMLLEKGFKPNDQENGGSSHIQSLLTNIDYSFDYSSFWNARERKDIDTSKAREKIKMIHLLARHGGKWRPQNIGQVAASRRSLLKMIPDYTVEFVWIMAGYEGCRREDIKELTRTTAMRKLIGKHAPQVDAFMRRLPAKRRV